jgi:hypothetical protein
MDAAHRPTFASLGVPVPLIAALATAGIEEPFPIQAAVLPDALAGADILGRARTGLAMQVNRQRAPTAPEQEPARRLGPGRRRTPPRKPRRP